MNTRTIQIGIVIIFVGLTIGISEGIGKHGFNPFVIPVVAIVFGCLALIVKTLARAGSSTQAPETDQRLAELENRIVDLQDIVISIDDRLKDMSARSTKLPD